MNPENHAAAFWARVEPNDPTERTACREWLGARDQNGYGQVSRTAPGERPRTWKAHRYAWTLTHGPIPCGLVIYQTCQRRGCCKPEHLKLGTREEGRAYAAEARAREDEYERAAPWRRG